MDYSFKNIKNYRSAYFTGYRIYGIGSKTLCLFTVGETFLVLHVGCMTPYFKFLNGHLNKEKTVSILSREQMD